MCGIVGIFRQQEKASPLSARLLAAMRDRMVHRGPDGAGLWIDPGARIGFGHLRLSIIDLDERAAQPMHSADGRFTITFNGEMYNYAEVKAALMAEGVGDWRTTSDTEVILKAFARWGIACLSRFRGMFAFALWDAAEGALWLVRDRIGIKPLYYSHRAGRIAFASEIKALLSDPQETRELDETSLFHFLSLMTTPAPRTMFRGIDKLPGGCFLRADANGLRVERYWDALDEARQIAATLPRDEKALVEALRAELAEAVRLRGVADVPVGVFLSGGIDSSTNATLFARTQQQPIKTFSIGYEGDHDSYRNELHYARDIATRIGSDHYERLLSVDDLLTLLPRIVHLQDEPIADPVCFPVYCVSELARQNGIKVAQVGEGADELFAGYPQWHRILRIERLARQFGAGGNWAARLALGALGKGDGQLAETLSRLHRHQPFFWSGAEIFPGGQKTRLLSPRLRARFAGRSTAEAIAPIMQRFADSSIEQSPLNWMSYVDLNLRLSELLLMRVDKMSMGVGLECREPFLDHRLVGFALAVPTAMKLAGNTPKSLLKKAVRGLLPDNIIDRPKQGFGVPIKEWFLGRLGPAVRDEIDAFLKATDLLDRNEIERLFAAKQGTNLWFLYNLAAWHRHFIREWEPARQAAA